MKLDFQCVRTQWIRGFIAFQLAQRTRTVRLMVPVGPESGVLVGLLGHALVQALT